MPWLDWSLAGAAPSVGAELATYVADSSHARFTGMSGLCYKTWRMAPGEWFEGSYVFESDAARAAFEATFRDGAADSPGSRIIGSPPVLVEPCQVVAIAEGAAGFVPAPRA